MSYSEVTDILEESDVVHGFTEQEDGVRFCMNTSSFRKSRQIVLSQLRSLDGYTIDKQPTEDGFIYYFVAPKE